MTIYRCLWIGVVGIIGMGTEETNPPARTIQEAFEWAQGRAQAGDLALAQQGCREALLLSFQKEKLTPEEQYLVGLCHLYLAALNFDQALQTGQLEAAQAQVAQAWRDLIWPQPAPGQPSSGLSSPGIPEPSAPPDPLITVGHGQEIDLAAILAPGKTTILLFSSNVAFCQRWEGYLRQLVSRRPDLVGVRALIDREGQKPPDFQSPLARQFKITRVPYLQIYGPDKKLQKEGPQAEEQVLQWFRERGQ